jgi:hypothetical protein
VGLVNKLKYAALGYLNQWLDKDSHYIAGLLSTNTKERIEALKKAVAFYRIARNLPLEHDRGQRLQPLLSLIDGAREMRVSEDNVVEAVEEFAGRVSAIYGGNAMTSLSSKVMWLTHKSPVIIYDSQARKALGAKARLHEYYPRWREKYRTVQPQIDEACEELVRVRDYCANPEIGEMELRKLAAEQWFKERVFDVHLWRIGTPS